MSLWCVQGGRHRLRKLAGAALCALLAAAIFGCGRIAPEGIWEPTRDDTAGIMAAVAANEGYFKTGIAELAMEMCDTVLPGTTRTLLNDELTGNRFKGRFRLDGLQHVFDTASYALKYTFIAGLDTLSQETTCTVTLAETIPGKVLMHAWQKTNYLYDSEIVISPTETLRLPFYTDSMLPCDTVIEKPLNGASIEGCVLKKMDGAWQLWKLAGGGRFYVPGPDDAPYILYLSLKSLDNRVDTVNLRPDTLHYGIQRFYSADTGLLTYSVGDWVQVTGLLTNQGDAWDYVYFNGKRYEYNRAAGSDTVKFDSVTPGIYRLSLEHIPAPVLWENEGDWNATVWSIPIRIEGGGR
ncbi:hypothetical protein JXD38_10560 [candidate division WOR-3 bacterium]|nr:hypothetical protein [candidate division WOR-3 bacterium]